MVWDHSQIPCMVWDHSQIPYYGLGPLLDSLYGLGPLPDSLYGLGPPPDSLYGLGPLPDSLYGLGPLSDSLYGLGPLPDSLYGLDYPLTSSIVWDHCFRPPSGLRRASCVLFQTSFSNAVKSKARLSIKGKPDTGQPPAVGSPDLAANMSMSTVYIVFLASQAAQRKQALTNPRALQFYFSPNSHLNLSNFFFPKLTKTYKMTDYNHQKNNIQRTIHVFSLFN